LEIFVMRYWHGGKGGMKRGQFVLPPKTTGYKSTAECGNYMCNPSVVYVTTEYTAAAMYAAAIPNGDIYEVEPIGELTHDPDCDTQGLSFSCDRAKILKRHRMTKAERAMVLAVLAAKA
jgi:hypothetical protein